VSERLPRLRRLAGRIGVRLLVVNLLALLVPAAGLEFARIYERQLLGALERDMRDQALLVRALCEADLAAGTPLADPRHAAVLTEAARRTRTRVRLLDEHGAVVADSHEHGPPEGPEPPPPSLVPGRRVEIDATSLRELARDATDPNIWPELAQRAEVRTALAGTPAARTRTRSRRPGVFLFVAEPLRAAGRGAGAVYVARSTQPVLVELYRIRSGLIRVLAVAFLGTGLVTALLALSISRPLGRLSRAAKRVAAGEPDVAIPVSGGGEIEELGQSFALMKERLAARLRYIEDFAADVAHELKSPLTSIRGAAELLGEGAADEPDARARFLRNIELDVARLDRLVSRLLELSRIEASSEAVVPIDLEALLRRAADRASAPDRPIELRVDGALGPVRGRVTDLETAFLNLLDNAVRFSPPGAPVSVRAAARSGAVEVVVADRGPGISEKNLPRIFDRFFTTDADKDGTGLGLSIVKAVALGHGGSVRAESRPGEGATFTVTLPARR
jgi:two-component system sensor histidine kinase ChvG